MFRNTVTKWLWDNRRSIAVWALSLSAVGGLYAALWPSLNNAQTLELLESYPDEILAALGQQDFTTASGYLYGSVYGLLAAVLLSVYGITAGARAVAGDEESGTMEIIIAHPISRTRLAVERAAALVISIMAISAAFLVVMLALRTPSQLDELPVGGFVAAHVQLGLFAVFFATLAFAVGAARGRRSQALAAGAVAVVGGFLANGLVPQIEGFEWIKDLSPFDWLVGGDPLHNGVNPVDCLLLAGFSVVFVAAGVLAFNRRDLMT